VGTLWQELRSFRRSHTIGLATLLLAGARFVDEPNRGRLVDPPFLEESLDRFVHPSSANQGAFIMRMLINLLQPEGGAFGGISMRAALTLVWLVSPSIAFALPAFPGAQGAGTETIGGRGGIVYVVDTTSDDPADGVTFREAVTASGPRIIVFAVSGNIGLTSPLVISNPNLTIAGQTSPGGVALVGQDVRLNTSDIIIRHMRFLRASGDGTGDVLFIGNGSNIVIDHCTIKWGLDETLQIGSYYGDVSDVTISHSIIAEGLDTGHPDGESNHALGINMSYKFARSQMPNHITLHHNFIAHFRYRIPQWVGPIGPSEFTNNVVYNWESRQSPKVIPTKDYLTRNEWTGPDIGAAAFLNYTHNYSKMGPDSNDSISDGGSSAEMYLPTSTTPEPRIYFTGNIGVTTMVSDNVWRVSQTGPGSGYVDEGWRSTAPHTLRGIPVTSAVMTPAYADEVLVDAGATKPIRDNTDAAVVATFANGNGTWPDTVDCNTPAGSECPTFSTANDHPTDTDGDGMPNAVETAQGTNPTVADDALFTLDANYTNIEIYINGLAGDVPVVRPNAPVLSIAP
jgi:hypothetical protein